MNLLNTRFWVSILFLLSFFIEVSAQINSTFLSFDGNDYLSIADTEELEPKDVTIEGWFLFENLDGVQVLISKHLGTNFLDSYLLWLNNGTLRGTISDNEGFTPVIYNDFSFQVNVWYHLAYTFNDDSDLQSLFINGQLVETNENMRSIDYDNQSLFLGASNDGGSPSTFFQGKMDEVRIWNKTLTESDINNSKNVPLLGNEDGLIGYWRINEGEGQITEDDSFFSNNARLGSSNDLDDNDPSWGRIDECNLQDGLAAYFPMNGNPHDVINGNLGTINGEPTLTTDRFGMDDSAYEFNDMDEFIDYGDSIEYQFAGGYSISLWMYMPSTEPQFGNLIQKRVPDGIFNVYGIVMASGQGNSAGVMEGSYPAFVHRSDGNQLQEKRFFRPNNVLSVGWHQIVVSNQKDGQAFIYIDNELVGTTQAANGTANIIGQSLFVGGNPDVNDSFKGKIDDIRIYQRFLSREEVGALYECEKPTVTGTDAACGIENGLLAYYPFNGNANDESGNGHEGNPTNSVSLTSDRLGNPDMAYEFNENGPIVIENKTDDFRFANQSMTLSVWATITKNTDDTDRFVSIGFGGNNDSPNIHLGKAKSTTEDGKIIMQINRGDDSRIFVPSILDGASLPKNTWMHVVGIIDEPNKKLKLYIDGVLQGEIELSLNTDLSTTSPFRVHIGSETFTNLGQTANHSGKLDDVRFYNRALSDAEVQSLYECEKPKDNEVFYVAERGGFVSRIDANGNRTEIAPVLNADGIVLKDANTAIVSQLNSNGNNIVSVNLTTGEVTDIASLGGVTQGIEIDNQGNVYVANQGSGKIQRVNLETKEVEDIVVGLTAGLDGPVDILVESENSILIVLLDGGRLLRFDFVTNTLETIVEGLDRPADIYQEQGGNLLIAEFGSQEITRVNINTREATTVTTVSGNPHGITKDKAGNILVTLFNSNQVVKIGTDGIEQPFADGFSNPVYIVNEDIILREPIKTTPTPIPFTCSEQIYEARDGQLSIANADGSNRMNIGTSIETVTALSYNQEDNLLYGISQSSNQLVIIDSNGELFRLENVQGNNGQLNLSGDIDNQGTLHLVDWNVDLVYKIDVNARPLTIDTIALDTDFPVVGDITFNPKTGLFYGIPNGGNNLYAFNGTTGEVTIIPIPNLAEGRFGATWLSNTYNLIAFDSDRGNLYEVNITTGESTLINQNLGLGGGHEGTRCALGIPEPCAGVDDADGDGICANEDCDDNNPNIGAKQTPGTSCDNGNGIIQTDGCSCEKPKKTISYYVAERGAGIVSKVSQDGERTVVANVSLADGVAYLDSNTVIISRLDANGTNIVKVDLNTGLTTNIAALGDRIQGIELDKFGNLYASNPRQGKVQKVNLETGEVQDIITGLVPSANLFLESPTTIIYPNSSAGTLLRYDLTTKTSEVVITGLAGGIDIYPEENGNLLVATYHGDAVYRVNLNTGESTLLAAINGGPHGVTKDVNGNIIVTLFDSNKLIMISPNGTVSDFAIGFNNPVYIVNEEISNRDSLIISPQCINEGGDADGDGICSEEDCNDNDPNVGAKQPEGTSCDDNDDNTINDVILADGCTCEGESGLIPFDCSSAYYHITNGQLKRFDITQNDFISIGPDHSSINAIGYNIEDNFIYGLIGGSRKRLVKIGVMGNIEDLGTIEGIPANLFTGDFDDSGNLYVLNNNNGKLFKIDVGAAELLVEEVEIQGDIPHLSDIAFDINRNVFYGLRRNNSNLVTIDLSNNVVTQITTQNVVQNEGFGSIYSTIEGNFYAFNNPTRTIYKIDVNTGEGNLITSISESARTSVDGASCPNAMDIFSSPAPCANNGGDADGDGICADEDCDDNDPNKTTDCPTENCDFTVGLAAYYPLNGNANDQSGNNVNGTERGSATYGVDRFDETGQSLNLNGRNGYVDFGDVLDLGTNDFAISLWMNPSSFPNDPNNPEILVNKGATQFGTPANAGYQFRIFKDNGINTLWFLVSDGESVVTKATDLETSEWYHVFGQRLGNSLSLYVNGAKIDTQPIDVSLNANTNVPFALGALHRGNIGGPTTSFFYSGSLDNYRLYLNRPFSDTEVQQLYDCEKPDNPCIDSEGDADGDGICADEDCNDNDPSIGAKQTPNTACDDGDGMTENDKILADGCTCQGEKPDCNLPIIRTTQISSGNNQTIVLFENDFEQAGDFTLSPSYPDISDDSVKNIFGSTFEQTFSVETILINGANNIYSDPQGNGGNFALGMLCCLQNDLLAFSFNHNGLPFVNLQMDISAIDLTGNNAPFGTDIPIFRVLAYDPPNDNFNINNPSNLLDSKEVTGEQLGADAFTFNWSTIISSLNIEDATNDEVTIVIDLIQGNYGALDNITITSSNEAGSIGNQIKAQACETATLTGAVQSDEVVTFSASFGTITQNGNNWIWTSPELQADDDQRVIISATNDCGASTIDFELMVDGSVCPPPPPCGEIADADGDGICADEDCNDNNPNIGARQLAGTSCDDGNPNTINDVIQSDGCTCEGEIPSLCENNGGDVDGDGICADEDCDDNNPDIGSRQQVGTSCNDGNPNTINDVIQSDGCTCEGELPPPCENNGGDADGDGICADADCDDNNPDIGARQPAGTSCNDGNPNTINDVIQADGCTCEGEIPPPCENNGGDADGDGICAEEDCDDNNPDIGAKQTSGTLCNNGTGVILADGCTCSEMPPPPPSCKVQYTVNGNNISITGLEDDHNKAYLYRYEEEGLVLIDSTCSYWQDCFSSKEFTNLPDGRYGLHYQTYINDWVDINCDKFVNITINAGSFGCESIMARKEGNQLIVQGLNAPNIIFDLFNENYFAVDRCIGDCGDSRIVENLAVGQYFLKVKFYDVNWNRICEYDREIHFTEDGLQIGQSRMTNHFSLAGYLNRAKVKLQWANTASTGQKEYVLEKSVDGIHFQSFMTQTAIEGKLAYADFDPNPAVGDNYYRVTTIFEDGHQEQSETIHVTWVIPNRLNLFPNPATEQVHINLSNYLDKEVNLIFTDFLGKVVYQQNFDSLTNSSISINLNQFVNGTYQVSTIHKGVATTVKLVVIK